MWYQNVNFWIDVSKIIAPVALGFIVWLSTRKFNKTQINLANDKLQKELFTEFNERYDCLNESLEELVKYKTLEELKNCKKGNDLYYKLSDYFNLCAEEYYWHKKGRIDELIWTSWKKGMDSWYNKHPIIQEAWNNEIEQYGRTAFYMNPTDKFFQEQ